MRRPRLQDERGQSLVEFALLLPILLALLIGAVQFGKAFFFWLDAGHLANTGARMAVVNRWPGCTTGTTLCPTTEPTTPPTNCGKLVGGTVVKCRLQTYLRQQANTTEFVNTGVVQVCFVGKDPPPAPPATPTASSATVGDPVRVTVRAPFNWLPFLKRFTGDQLTTITIRSSATMRLEQAPTRYTGTRCTGT